MKMSLWQYLRFNREVGIYCLKICTIIFFGFGILISLALYLTKGIQEKLSTVILSSALLGYSLAIFIFILALTSAYLKARQVVRLFNRIPLEIRKKESLEVGIKSWIHLNPKESFAEFIIIRKSHNTLEQVKEYEIKQWI